jgi:hypothetical protein
MTSTTLTLTFDQPDAGIPAGVVDRARTDISSAAVGDSPRAAEVIITIGGIPDGATCDVVLLDEPPGSNPLLTQDSATQWRLAFDAGCWGPFRIRCRAVVSNVVVQSVVRRISIRSPHLSMQYPANAERTDPNATKDATVQSVQLTEMNEGGTNRPLVDFHRATVEMLEAIYTLLGPLIGGGGGGGGASSTRKSIDVDFVQLAPLPSDTVVSSSGDGGVLLTSAPGSTEPLIFDGDIAAGGAGPYGLNQTVLVAFDATQAGLFKVVTNNSPTDWQLQSVELPPAPTLASETEYRVRYGAAYGGRRFMTNSVNSVPPYVLQRAPLSDYPILAGPLNGTPMADGMPSNVTYSNQHLLVGKVNLLDTTVGSGTMTMTLLGPLANDRIMGERFAVKVVASSGPRSVSIAPNSNDQTLESPTTNASGAGGAPVTLTAKLGTYVEWQMGTGGNWFVVGYQAGT